MAIYHCSIKPISRGAGQSIVASAAYRNGCRLTDERTGQVFDYSQKRGVACSAIRLPGTVVEAWDRASLWNAVEASETRKNSRLGREVEIALPHELEAFERQALAMEYADHIANRYGVAVDVAVHAPGHRGDDRNHHAHILFSSRRITSQGLGIKARVLDDQKTGPQEVEHLRETWEILANRYLEPHGLNIDRRCLEAQGSKRQPGIHVGPHAMAIERRGGSTERGELQRQIQHANTKLEQASLAEGQAAGQLPQSRTVGTPHPRDVEVQRLKILEESGLLHGGAFDHLARRANRIKASLEKGLREAEKQRRRVRCLGHAGPAR